MSAARRRVTTAGGGPTHVKQAFKDECDINKIMAKFQKTGLLEHTRDHQGDYTDYSDFPSSYHEACNQALKAEQMFLTIPSSIRAKFANDPGQFLDFVDDPKNEAALVSMGLANAKLPPEDPKPPIPPPGAPTEASGLRPEVPSTDGPPSPPRPTPDPA